MSALRLLALATAVALAVRAVRRLARRGPTPGDGLTLVVAALAALVGLDPGVVNWPAELLRLRHWPDGRLLTLLLLSNIAVWLYLLAFRDRRQAGLRDVQAQTEAVLAHVLTASLPPLAAPVAVVMPAYNEEACIGGVLRAMPPAVGGEPAQAVVVADGCRDGTAAVARKHGAVVLELPVNLGGGAALRIGYDYAARSGARVVVTMDADGQHRPEDLDRLVAPILAGRADVVVGSRRLGAGRPASGLRGIGLVLSSALLGVLLATRLTDCSSGLRAFAVDRLPRLLTSERQYHTAETLILARRSGLRIAEVPVRIRPRAAGSSKKGHDIAYGYQFARVIIAHWMHG